MRDQEPGSGDCLQLYDFALLESHVSPVTHAGQLLGKDTDDLHIACHIQNLKNLPLLLENSTQYLRNASQSPL